jgi:hypothetical protein
VAKCTCPGGPGFVYLRPRGAIHVMSGRPRTQRVSLCKRDQNHVIVTIRLPPEGQAADTVFSPQQVAEAAAAAIRAQGFDAQVVDNSGLVRINETCGWDIEGDFGDNPLDESGAVWFMWTKSPRVKILTGPGIPATDPQTLPPPTTPPDVQRSMRTPPWGLGTGNSTEAVSQRGWEVTVGDWGGLDGPGGVDELTPSLEFVGVGRLCSGGVWFPRVMCVLPQTPLSAAGLADLLLASASGSGFEVARLAPDAVLLATPRDLEYGSLSGVFRGSGPTAAPCQLSVSEL